MTDDRGLLHVGPSAVGRGLAGNPDEKVRLLLVVGLSFEDPVEPAGEQREPRVTNVEPSLLAGLPNGGGFERLAVLDGASNEKPHGRLIGQSRVDAAEQQDTVVRVDEQDLRADPSESGHQSQNRMQGAPSAY